MSAPEQPFKGKRVLVHAYERVWPIDSGFAVRVWQQLDTLQSLGAEVHLLGTDVAMSAVRTRWSAEASRHLKQRGITLHRHHTHVGDPDFWVMAAWHAACKRLGRVVWPEAGTFYYWRPNLCRKWRQILRKEGIQAALVNYAFWHRLARAASDCGVWSAIEMHELLSQQLEARYLTAGRLKPSERLRRRHLEDELRCLSSADVIVAINESEGKSIEAAVKTPVVYLPMCLQERSVPAEARVESDILVVGSFIENNRIGLRRFLEGSWPEIRAKRPGTNFMVCGRVGEIVPPDSGIETRLDVPDLTPFYEGAKIVVLVTVAGAGIKIKAVEALSHGCCIVSHSHSVSGIPFTSGLHGMVVEDLGSAAGVILELLGNPGKRNSFGTGARSLFRARHGFERSREAVQNIFATAFK